MDGHGQPALLYIVPFTVGKLLNSNMKKIDSNIYRFKSERVDNDIDTDTDTDTDKHVCSVWMMEHGV